MKKLLLIFMALSTILSVSCSAPESALYSNFAADFENISYIEMTNDDGETITVTEKEDFSFIKNYNREGLLPGEKRREINTNSKTIYVQVFDNAENENQFYILESGEIALFYKPDPEKEGEFYLYKANENPVDSEYINSLFEKYK